MSERSKRIKLWVPERREFRQIPVFIVEYHNEILDFIYRCLATRHLPLQGNTLIHFDSHPDMVVPNHISPETVFDQEELLRSLSIENWIIPACFAGHFTKIIWIKNSWCTQIPDGIYTLTVGEYNEKLYVDLPEDYFIAEGSHCNKEDLKQTKIVELEVITFDSQIQPKLLQKTDSVILDIDLDFFSVKNPFLEIYPKANTYKKLTKIFSYDSKANISKAEISKKRREQLKNLKRMFKHLKKMKNLNDFENNFLTDDEYQIILNLVKDLEANYNLSDIDWMKIYDAGCTCDHEGLPHHITNDTQLKTLFNNFDNFLQNSKINPTIVTISRSAEDEYTPADQVDLIQENVLNALSTAFTGKIACKPTLAYINDDWNVMTM